MATKPNDPKWHLDYNGTPPPDDDNDYVWSSALRRWIVDDRDAPEIDDDAPEIDDDALERAERRRIKRIEWDTYHPGEPCPAIELDD